MECDAGKCPNCGGRLTAVGNLDCCYVTCENGCSNDDIHDTDTDTALRLELADAAIEYVEALSPHQQWVFKSKMIALAKQIKGE